MGPTNPPIRTHLKPTARLPHQPQIISMGTDLRTFRLQPNTIRPPRNQGPNPRSTRTKRDMVRTRSRRMVRRPRTRPLQIAHCIRRQDKSRKNSRHTYLDARTHCNAHRHTSRYDPRSGNRPQKGTPNAKTRNHRPPPSPNCHRETARTLRPHDEQR